MIALNIVAPICGCNNNNMHFWTTHPRRFTLKDYEPHVPITDVKNGIKTKTITKTKTTTLLAIYSSN